MSKIINRSGIRILVTHEYPPIPCRNTDYSAVDYDRYDGAPDAGPQRVGWGSTEEEAIAELLAETEDA